MRIRYLKQEKSRHGKPRLYVRLPGQPMIRLPVELDRRPGLRTGLCRSPQWRPRAA